MSTASFLDLEPKKKEGKPDWSALPPALILDIENLLKAKIIDSVIVWGGYSPSASFCITVQDGRKFFIKGTHPEQTAHGAQMMRQEISAYQNVPYLAVLGVDYLGSVSFGNEDDWFLGVFEYIENAVQCRPWTVEKADQIIHALYNMHKTVRYDDVKSHVNLARDTNYISNFVLGTNGWLKFKTEERKDKFCRLFEKPDQAKDWLAEALPAFEQGLNDLEHVNQNTAQGLLHFDLRSDNILFDQQGQVKLLDWPNICWGAILFDLVSFFTCVEGEDGPSALYLLNKYQDISGQSFSDQEVFAVLSSISGYFADNAYRDVPDTLPRLRWIQKIQLDSSLKWAYELGMIPQYPALSRI